MAKKKTKKKATSGKWTAESRFLYWWGDGGLGKAWDGVRTFDARTRRFINEQAFVCGYRAAIQDAKKASKSL